MIGRGSYGKVYLVSHLATEQVYAMKSIKKDLVIETDQADGIKGISLKFLNFALAERDILLKFDHPFIMKLQFSFQDTLHLYFIMDFINGGELFYHLQ